MNIDTADLIAAHGVELDLDDGDLVSRVLVIAEVINPDGGTSIELAWSDGTSWVAQLGLITAAAGIVQARDYDRFRSDGEDLD